MHKVARAEVPFRRQTSVESNLPCASDAEQDEHGMPMYSWWITASTRSMIDEPVHDPSAEHQAAPHGEQVIRIGASSAARSGSTVVACAGTTRLWARALASQGPISAEQITEHTVARTYSSRSNARSLTAMEMTPAYALGGIASLVPMLLASSRYDV